jgi:hypothetical protein
MIRTISATRYVTPLREGLHAGHRGADDLGLDVLKFRGAGQGALALAAELICAGIGRALDLPVPEVVFASVDADLGRNEGDPEIRELLQASLGNNLAMDYLPGSVMFDPAARDPVDPMLAARTVWFDAFVTNVDRTARNPNLLCWHRSLYLIDHGAARYVHHDCSDLDTRARTRFPLVRDPCCSLGRGTGSRRRVVAAAPDPPVLEQILQQVPDDWLLPRRRLLPRTPRAGYLQYLARLEAAPSFVEEALDARARLV